MKKLVVGLIGWRGMVGSVLMQRMSEEGDFKNIDALFFSTSQVGQKAPKESSGSELFDAYDLKKLREMDVILSCQGGQYTEKVHGPLRESNWQGHWIDAASTLRLKDSSCLVLDPINGDEIDRSLDRGARDLIGANCTVSLMLMAIGGLFEKDAVEWVSSMTYQAASGGGAQHMKELVRGMGLLGDQAKGMFEEDILSFDKKVGSFLSHPDFPIKEFGAPLAGSLIPWIDTLVENGQTREERKGMLETNKILQTKSPIPIDGTCVRVGVMRCHSQGLTIKLKKDYPLDELSSFIKESNPWVSIVENSKESVLEELGPKNVSGTLKIPVGRLRKMALGPEFLNAFTVGDQLLWGAAEPLRRALMILCERA